MKKSPFILQLLADKTSELFANKNASRLAKAMKRKQEALVDGINEQLDTALNKIEDLKAMTMEDFPDVASQSQWITDYQQAKLDVKDLTEQLEIAEDTFVGYFDGKIEKEVETSASEA